MAQDRASIVLDYRAAPRGIWGQRLARMACALFALVGILPILLVVILRLPQVRTALAERTQRIIQAQGINASYEAQIHLWPTTIELEGVRIESTDGGSPALRAPRVLIKPKVLSLLSGKVELDEVSIDSPNVRLVIHGNRIENLGIELPKSDPNAPKTAFRAPFGTISLSDGTFDIRMDENHVELFGVDADVLAENDKSARESVLEVSLRANRAALTRVRHDGDVSTGAEAIDEDELCGIDGRVRIAPSESITVRRLTVHGAADHDAGVGTFPGCSLPKDDPRRIDLNLGHVQVLFGAANEMPRISGHIAGRIPLFVISRLPGTPTVDGYAELDTEVRLTKDSKLPETDGTVHVHDARIDNYALIEDLTSALSIHRDIIESSETTVKIAGGTAILKHVQITPFARNIPISADVDVQGASFEELMRELDVSKAPHVGWSLDALHVEGFHGTLNPLKLDGMLSGTTSNFAVFDSAVRDPKRHRIVGFATAQFAGKVLVRPDALQFADVRAVVGRSVLEGGFVSIGFHNQLRVDVPRVDIDLRDITPLGSMPIAGHVKGDVHVAGVFGAPHLEADATIDDFVLADMPLGNITAGHGVLRGAVLELSGIKAIKGKSHYEMSSGRLDFGGSANVTLDADASSNDFQFHDFLSLFRMDRDPRFEGLDAIVDTHTNIRVVLGGVEDPCGGGVVQVKASVHGRQLSLFGERFDDAHGDIEFNWLDRNAGIEGADLNVRALALHKVHKEGQPPSGSVIGSALMARGGELRGHFVYDSLSLARIDTLGAMRELVSGNVAGVANLSGPLDAFEVNGTVDVSPVRLNAVPYPASRLTFKMTTTSQNKPPIGTTACGGAIQPLFDKPAYLATADTVSSGAYLINGNLFGGQIVFDNFTMSRQKHSVFAGRIAARDIDLGALRNVLAPADDVDWDGETKSRVGGTFSADLLLERVAMDDLAHAKATLIPKVLRVQLADQTIALEPTTAEIRFEHDVVAIPPLTLSVASGRGMRASLALSGAMRDVLVDPKYDITMQISPVDLGILVGLVPRFTRAQGTLTGRVAITGRVAEPDVDGEMHLRRGEFAVTNVPGVISDVTMDVSASANELRLSWGTAKYAGGDIVILGRMPLVGGNAGAFESSIVARGLHLSPSDGIRSTLDLDLSLGGNAFDTHNKLPRLSGTVGLISLEYTKPFNIDITQGLGNTSKRTVVDNYDPSLDSIALDLNVVAKAPIRIRNNLADFELGIESPGLQVTGTNQRYGLRGELRALPQGRVRFLANEFELRQVSIRFDDPTRISPYLDATAITDYRRYSAIGAATGPSAGRSGSTFRISLHAFGPAEDPKVEMTSEPALSQEDISLLLTVGLTKAEVDQLGSSALTGFAYEAVGTVSGADRIIKKVIPVDDFHFGSWYSPRTGRSEPNITFGQRLPGDLRASFTSGLSEDRQLRTIIEWRLNNSSSIEGSYDNINNVSAVGVGNFGLDYRLRIEWE